MVTHQLRDAFYIATHEARPVDGRVEFVRKAEPHADETEFMMLRDGRIAFEGTAADLRKAGDAYIQSFLS
jgi:hypothetical protein